MSKQKSTIDRTINRAGFAGLRLAFGVLERCAPELGARWAVRLWFTASAIRNRTDRYPPDGVSFTVDVHGRPVVGRRWGSGPVVYLVHGWGGRGGQLAGFIPPLVEAGFSVVAHDALGHGGSASGRDSGRRTTLPEMADALQVVESEYGPAAAVIAHSAGAVAAALAFEDGMRPPRVAFVAPVVDPFTVSRGLARQLGFGERIRRRMIERAERHLRFSLSALDVLRIAERLDPAPPLLVVHDRGDRDTPFEEGAKLADAWPNGRLYATHGLGHRRILTDDRVIDEVVAFIRGAEMAGSIGGAVAE